MEPFLTPEPPIPEPLRGEETGSFAHFTVTQRFPAIVRQVLDENQFPAEIVARLEALIDDIPAAQLRQLQDTTAPDAAAWIAYLSPYEGQNWLQVPWFFAETYFYRRILEATGYFLPGDWQGFDPYEGQKRNGLKASLPAIQEFAERLQEAQNTDIPSRQETLSSLLISAVWGNQADLSMWFSGDEDAPPTLQAQEQKKHLLIDDTQAIVSHLLNEGGDLERVDVLADNTGLELFHDLCLVDYLLAGLSVRTVFFHLKFHPTFVSDAMPKDVLAALAFLSARPETEIASLARRMQDHLDSGRLRLHNDLFWTSPLPAWEIPALLRQQLAQSNLILSKGDANYRRLIGDRHWGFSHPIASILRYRPAPLAALRVFKSEVAAGLAPGLPNRMESRDPEWLIDGHWGEIQFAGPLD